MKLEIESTVSHDDAVIFSDLDNNIVMMNVENGEYYDFDEIASYIWRKLDEPIIIKQLCADLCDAFTVDAATCQADTLEFLDDLLGRKLIVTH
ncbi:PqqD family protein [Altererythrobacter sp. RZ02]|uniref:PqqD family protein n=1 Tax=Pontixanthobacter rizhaonensis TaxID=2730337 RepID=A0A848QPB5_9SPHN|nr:PqqD family protein [Pontixanthobacter rizhaonensis]